MTQIDGWQMTGNVDSFRKGATAFRNARDRAKEHRDRFIGTANEKAKQSREAVAQQDEGSSEDGFLDYEENTASQETLRQPQPLPQSSTDYSAFQDINGSPSLPQYPEDDQATSQDINEGPSL